MQQKMLNYLDYIYHIWFAKHTHTHTPTHTHTHIHTHTHTHTHTYIYHFIYHISFTCLKYYIVI